MQFEFATAGRIIFGAGSAARLPGIIAELGSRVFHVTGGRNASPDSLVVRGEPTVGLVRRGAELCREKACDVVLGTGGGSVIDAAKAVAVLATNPGDPLDYLEVIGRGKPLSRPGLPCIAVPTTAGTGSEVTRNAVLGSHEHGVKASLRSPFLLPRTALIDPELTLGLPPAITAATGLDALTQLIEPFVSLRANAFTDPFCLEGIRRVAGSLRSVYSNGGDIQKRTDMSFAALLGGLALANSGLGVIHGFASPIGGRFPAPHGAVCAALLPHGMAANIAALRSLGQDGLTTLERYRGIARVLTGRNDVAPEDGASFVAQLCSDLQVPRLGSYGISEADVDHLVAQAANASSMKANPLVLSTDQLRGVLLGAI